MTEELNIIKNMEIVGKKLKENPPENAALLRDFIRELRKCSAQSHDKDLIFLSYFFNSFIEDVWSNIAVDSSYREEISDEDKDVFLSRLGERIESLSVHLDNKDFTKCHETCVDMIDDYLKVVDEFETKIEGHLAKSIAQSGGVSFE